MSDAKVVNKDQLIADMKVVVSDAEELLRATASQAGEKVTALRGKIEDNLVKARASLADAQAAVVDKAKEFGHETDEFVKDNPWKSVGIAAGIGLVVGILIGRR